MIGVTWGRQVYPHANSVHSLQVTLHEEGLGAVGWDGGPLRARGLGHTVRMRSVPWALEHRLSGLSRTTSD